MSTPNYDINYNDSRFTKVESDKRVALSELEKTYGGMIDGSDKYYQAQIDASKEWADTQSKNQQAQTDFAIEQIEQQKDQAQKDYTKEQSGAYVDWQKQSNQYGADAEQKAAQGMANTGYSESSQVSMYNTYQQRVVAAREAYSRAVLNYDNAIKDARLQNNSVLAQIAYEALQKQLELSLQGFQYKNQLILEKANQKTALENTYYQRYQDVIKQINTENTLAEEVRQYNETLAEQKRQHSNTLAMQRKQLQLDREKFAWQKAQASSNSSGGGGGSGGSSGGGRIDKGGSSGSGSSGSGINKTSNSNPTIDMNSVLSLGYGPISEKELDRLVRSGEVEEYTMGGKIMFKKVNKSTSNKTYNKPSNRVFGAFASKF